MKDGGDHQFVLIGHPVQHLAGCVLDEATRCWHLVFRTPIIRRDFGEFSRVDNSRSERLFDCLGFLYREVMVSFLLFWSILSVVTNSRSSFCNPQMLYVTPRCYMWVSPGRRFEPHTIEVAAFRRDCVVAWDSERKRRYRFLYLWVIRGFLFN